MTGGNGPTTSGRTKEYAKIALRTALHRRNLDIVRNPFPVRVSNALRCFGVSTVLDVGANIGQYGSALRASGYRERLISCEPLPDAYAVLQRRSAGDPNWTAVNAAVGSQTGTLAINVAANSYSSSALPMTAAHLGAAPESGYIGTVEVALTTVADLVAEHRVEPARTLLKIDTQGYEAEVLAGAGDLLGGFPLVQLELSMVPLYEGQVLYPELVERMAAAGYGIFGLEAGIADPESGRMLQCDGMFARSDLL